ncbi:AlpA family phage regulatory protein [Acidobacteria bacterium AH-259-D05]|nr:AlpA family phage regulatory protein [Acidobacteria bacterium AH-259-D05]
MLTIKHETLKCIRYAELVELGIVRNRMTLRRWILSGHFPQPVRLGGNSIAWLEKDVRAWLESREKAYPAASEA